MSNATWIPGAGGYVLNGQVVSKNPIYDTNGKQVVDVTMEQINNSSNTNQTVNANNVQNQTGATVSTTATANKANTNMQTAIGSLGTTNNNTQTSGTAVSSPATNTPQGNAQVLDPVQKYITDFSTALANQDLNGQITALTELDKYTVSQGGTAQYSELIGNLQKQNTEQITNTVNDYALRISEAMRAGNTDLVNGLKQELESFKQTNNYDSILEAQNAEIATEYSFAYMQGINDITNGLLSLVGQYSNFVYDPYSDPALQMAQGYAVSAVKEQMNATGMYYSSMTQSAITRAITELIPVYEQMAKDEILENINLLQSTASYLMNLEQFQFDIWSSQIELQLLKNQEKRAEIESAWERVNNIGYVDNEASLILGVDVGTLSLEVRKMIMQEEADIRAEERALKNQMTIQKYTHDLAVERDKLQAELDLSTNMALATFKAGLEGQSSVKDPTTGAVDYTKEPNGTLTLDQLLKTAQNLKQQGVDKSDILAEIYVNAKDSGTAYGAISSANIESETSETGIEYIFDNEFIRKYGLSAYANLLELEEGSKTPEDLLENSAIAITKIKTMQTEGTITEEEANALIQKYGEDSVAKVVEENKSNYSNNEAQTKNALSNSQNAIAQYVSPLYEANMSIAENITIALYKYLFDSIAEADNTFDYKEHKWRDSAVWGTENVGAIEKMNSGLDNFFNEGDRAKQDAMSTIIDDIIKSKYYGESTQNIATELSKYLYEKSQDMNGYDLLKNKSAYKLKF